MAEYKYGVYGKIGNDVVQSVSRASVTPVYFGTAPVNLLTDYRSAVNTPIKIYNLNEAREKLGHFANSAMWSKYTLCEAVEAHFNNEAGNIGPIYVINVLDPDVHASEAVTEDLIFANRKATLAETDIILATFALDGKVQGVDYTISYNSTTGVLTVTDIGQTPMEEIQASFKRVNFEEITAETVIGGTDSDGLTTGIASLRQVYQNYDAIPTYLAAPGWSEDPMVYDALVEASQGINDHWSAFVFADIPTTNVANIAAAIKWKEDNEYTSGYSKVFWPKVKSGSATVYHLSTLALVEKIRCDINNNNIPFETCANKSIPASGLYISDTSKLVGYDRPDANKLTAAGITTAIYWGGNWRVWGDHTAAYVNGGDYMAREIFDTNMLMLFYITNEFQREWGTTIDQPMTLALRDTILNREQEKLDALVSIGALIGTPTVELSDGESSEASDVLLANFEWHISATITPPLKAATVTVSYTDAGFAVLYGDEEGGEA